MALDDLIFREYHHLWPELSLSSSSTFSSTPQASAGSQGASGPLGFGGLYLIKLLALFPSEMVDLPPLPLIVGEMW